MADNDVTVQQLSSDFFVSTACLLLFWNYKEIEVLTGVIIWAVLLSTMCISEMIGKQSGNSVLCNKTFGDFKKGIIHIYIHLQI